ncbi:MAG: marine proteobacterial sortase target protein [Oceanococcus sp.]
MSTKIVSLSKLAGLLLAMSSNLAPSTALAISTDSTSENVVRLGDVRRGSLMFRQQHDQDQALWQVAPTLQTDVSINISGPIARTVLTQHFRNPGDSWTEATYVFPLPETAAVDHMRMRIGERVIEGEIQEKQQAKKIYEQGKREGKRSALIEQVRSNMFTAKVANIPPHGEVKIELEYQQELHWRDGEFSLRFPMAITPRYKPAANTATTSLPETPQELLHTQSDSVAGWSLLPSELPHQAELDPSQQGLHNPTSIQVKLQAGFETGPVLSPYHAIHTQDHTDYSEIQLAAGQVASDRDFVLRWSPRDKSAVHAAYFVENGDDGHYGLLLLMPPQQAMQGQHSRSREVIFVIDTSGSMGGESIRAARAGLLAGLDRLSPGDSFNLIEFDSSASALFNQAVPVNADNLHEARRWTKRLNANGGTEMSKALQLALPRGPQGETERLRQIVFITDGAVGNEAELMSLIHARLGDARLFTVGIGSAPNAHFMTEAAHFGRGSFSYIANIADVESSMRKLFAQLNHPALTDIELKLPVATDALPAPIPDLYVGEPISVVMKLADKAEQAQLFAQLGLRPWQHDLNLQSSVSQSGLATLWARRKITDWTRQERRGLAHETARQEILKLALQHHLVSRYTSLVAVDKTPIRDAQDPLQKHALKSNLPMGMSVPLAQGATPSLLLLLSGGLLLMLAWLLHAPRAQRSCA